MGRKIFIFFVAVVIFMLASTLGLIQTRKFGDYAKSFFPKLIPQEIGLQPNFSRIEIKLFPLRLSILDPKFDFSKNNVAGLPPEARMAAKQIYVQFSLSRLLTGAARVSQVTLEGGEIFLPIDSLIKRSKTKKNSDVVLPNWDELEKLHIDTISLENTKIQVEWKERGKGIYIEVYSKNSQISQWTGKGGIGYRANINLQSIKQRGLPEGIPQLISDFVIDAQGNSLSVDLKKMILKSEGIAGRPLVLEGKGLIQGNVFDEKNSSLTTKASIQGTTPISELVQWLGIQKHLPGSKGNAIFKGELTLDLLNPNKKLTGYSELKLKEFQTLNWSCDEGSTKFSIQDSNSIVLDHFECEAAQRHRVPNKVAGSGGKISVGKTAIQLNPFRIPEIKINFESAHIHWLLGPVAQDAFNVDFKVNGAATASLLSKSNGVSGKFSAQIQVPHLALDNQKLTNSPPFQEVLRAKNIGLKFAGVFDEEGIEVETGDLRLAATQAQVQASIRFKEGISIKAMADHASGEDLEHLIGKKLKGNGPLEFNLTGPFDHLSLEFLPKFKDTYFLDMSYGDVTGRIVYDDRDQIVLLEKMVAKIGNSTITGGGTIDTRGKGDLDLQFTGRNLETQDIFHIFKDLTDQFWWFPRQIIGVSNIVADLKGGLDIKDLQIYAKGTGLDWDYFGEKFRQVEFVGQYVNETIEISRFLGRKARGSLLGNLKFHERSGIEWKVSSDGLALSDLEHLASLDVPVKGSISMSSSGKGIGENVVSKSTIDISNVIVKGSPYPDSRLAVSTRDGYITASGNLFSRQATFDLNYSLAKEGRSDVEVSANGLDLAPLFYILNSRLIQDKEMKSSLTGRLKLDFNSGQVEVGTGLIEVQEILLKKVGVEFRLKDSIRASIKRGTFNLERILFLGGETNLRGNLSAQGGVLSGNMGGTLDLSLIEFLAQPIERITGIADANLQMTGPLKNLFFKGDAKVRNGVVKISNLETPLENIESEIRLNGDMITVDSLESSLGGGVVTSKGTIELFATKFPTMHLNVTARECVVRAYPFQYVKFRSDLVIEGIRRPYLVSGSAEVGGALIRESFSNQQKKVSTARVARFTPASAGSEGDVSFLRLNIAAKADRGIFIKNDLLDTEWRGDVRLVNSIETFRILGEGSLVSGKLNFKDKSFLFQSAKVAFDNPTVFDPKFDAVAYSEIGNSRIRLYAFGRISDWKAELTSNPALPESEILQLLALGLTSDDMHRLRRDRSIVNQSEAASLILQSLEFNRDVEDKTGIKIELNEAQGFGYRSAVGAGEVGFSSSPKIVIRKEISKNIDVLVGNTVGVGSVSQREVNAEVKIRPGVSMVGVWNSSEEVGESEDKQTSFGVDLKVQKKFK